MAGPETSTLRVNEQLSKEPGFLILRLLKPGKPNPSPPN